MKEVAGKISGNKWLEAEGKTDRAKGKVKQAAHNVGEAAKGVADSLDE